MNVSMQDDEDKEIVVAFAVGVVPVVECDELEKSNRRATEIPEACWIRVSV